MKSLNDYFDKIYCINLEKSTDRWKECSRIFEKHNLNVERVEAIDGSLIKNSTNLLAGEYGCLLSHFKVLNLCKNQSINRALILEDDVEFNDNLTNLFSEYIEQVPEWDLLYFGGNHTPSSPNFVSENVLKLNHSYAIHAYGVNSKSIDVLLQNVKDSSIQIDVVYANLQAHLNVYSFYPALAWQRKGFSFIHNTLVDYSFLKY